MLPDGECRHLMAALRRPTGSSRVPLPGQLASSKASWPRAPSTSYIRGGGGLARRRPTWGWPPCGGRRARPEGGTASSASAKVPRGRLAPRRSRTPTRPAHAGTTSPPGSSQPMKSNLVSYRMAAVLL